MFASQSTASLLSSWTPSGIMSECGISILVGRLLLLGEVRCFVPFTTSTVILLQEIQASNNQVKCQIRNEAVTCLANWLGDHMSPQFCLQQNAPICWLRSVHAIMLTVHICLLLARKVHVTTAVEMTTVN